MSLEQLHTELVGLDFILGTEVKRDVSAGKYHQGQSAVVQLLVGRTA